MGRGRGKKDLDCPSRKRGGKGEGGCGLDSRRKKSVYFPRKWSLLHGGEREKTGPPMPHLISRKKGGKGKSTEQYAGDPASEEQRREATELAAPKNKSLNAIKGKEKEGIRALFLSLKGKKEG